MSSNAKLAEIASLAGDPARAGMLHALMDGRALTATELARAASITRSASALSPVPNRCTMPCLFSAEVRVPGSRCRTAKDSMARKVCSAPGRWI